MVFPAILCFQNSPFEVTYPLLYSKWITNKEDLLYSTWSSTQFYVAARMGGGFGGEWIHVSVWLSPCAVHLKPPQHLVQFSRSLCDPMNRSAPGLSVHRQLLEFTQTQSIESVMPSSHLILCRPLLLLPPSFPASGSLQMSQLFASGCPSTAVSASTSVPPVNTQD